ncbi:aldehyde dehydrogenase family protein [Amycolatopsis sp. K13G38]|uniref:aldehyde dehydrogenase (NAD(+)) n=1 Tax=Amycolatopsis acididurans TaxID=2724524 RepID=A0ABX1JAD6_9PSEU|nr:aldehyde dehydrogenase family protein [Amycolatopsis acididurans]NKQ56745.1 aldehyde dehydrogenase family protein [Amycolatopsis acididurans]
MTSDLYVGGSWTSSTGAERVTVLNPATEEAIGDVPSGTPEDVALAVRAARRAFEDWAETGPGERAKFVARLADELERRQDEITGVLVAEVGTPRRVARWAQVGLGIVDLREASAAAAEFAWQENLRNSLIIREAIGVVGCITPWNYPLHQITAKIGAALCAGCTVVVKASEVAPLTARALAQAIDAVGFPPGVFNLLHGYGTVVGEALARHPDVDMVSFTGSTAVGRRILELAAPSIKRVALELGGKSASVLLDDADLAVAVPHTVRASYLNGGQSCNAQTRMLVARHQLAEAGELAAEAAAQYVPGDPADDATKLGPMVSAVQRDRVLSYVRQGIEDGARLLTGSPEPSRRHSRGYFVEPAVFSEVDPNARIAQEEIFGPVLSIIPYDTDEEAVAIANGTPYGLAGAVWSADAQRAQRVARRLRATQIEVNGGKFNAAAPFGGYRQSGLGREGEAFGLGEFVEVKSLQL